jgi:hypothetical protein
MSALRSRLTFANVTSAVALFVALGGTSYAALQLPANSVDSREIRTGAVGTSELRTGAAGSAELRTDSVRPAEIRRDAVRGEELATGAAGSGEVRDGAVREEEIATGGVGTAELRDGQVALDDLATATRAALTDTASVTFRAAVGSAGGAAGGNATSVSRSAAGVYAVELGRDVSACQYAATLAAVRVGGALEQPPAGRITAAPGATANSVTVRTFAADAAAADAPFHLLVAC